MNIYVGMTDEQRSVYTKDDFIQMKELLDAGEMDRKEYIWFYTQYLMNFIKSRIRMKTHISPASQEYEDLLCEGIAVITEKIDAYNPLQSGPSTYFAPYIDERLQRTTQTKLSHYYNQMANQLNQTAITHGYEGINDERLTTPALAALADIPLSTVANTREQAGYTMESLSNYRNNILDERKKSPEELFVSCEAIQMLSDALKACTPLERFLLLAIDVDRCSFRKILDILKSEELCKKFPGEITPKLTQEYLARKLRSGQNHMRRILGCNEDDMLRNVYVVLKDLHPTEHCSVMDLLDEILYT